MQCVTKKEQGMQRSAARILTTHVGSLPRPEALADLLVRHERGEAIDEAERDRLVAAAVEHVVQKQVAQRILQAVEAVGERSRIVASTDCGFGTFAGSVPVAESVVWAKLRTLRQGADLASTCLWGNQGGQTHDTHC
jgi:methionine synthase II (cobalamin-independent)